MLLVVVDDRIIREIGKIGAFYEHNESRNNERNNSDNDNNNNKLESDGSFVSTILKRKKKLITFIN